VHLQPESETLYCARPVFASEELTWLREGEQLIDLLPKPLPDGCKVLHFTPLELLEKMRAGTARRPRPGLAPSRRMRSPSCGCGPIPTSLSYTPTP